MPDGGDDFRTDRRLTAASPACSQKLYSSGPDLREMTVRVRGIYTTALTELLTDVVQASDSIERRFEESFPITYAAATVETTADRQGVGVHGTRETVRSVTDDLSALGRDTFVWPAPLPRGAVYAGEVVETLGSGALVDCGTGTGFLPFSKTAAYIDVGDCLRVQVAEPRPPWRDGRPVLDTTVLIHGELASLVRGGAVDGSITPELADLLPADPPAGWGVDWADAADDAPLEALSETVDALGERATGLDEGLTDAPAPAESPGHTYWSGAETRWVWFGRESRFALDGCRRAVVPTMAGHHRIKAGGEGASAAVDFVERVCETPGSEETERAADDSGGQASFPFDAVIGQFGPAVGDSIRIGHGKPDGRCIELGPGKLTAIGDGAVTVERQLSGGGTYDALGVAKEAGDVARTTFEEGRWWYPTVYRGEDGTHRGTYVNVCTPVEVFPDEVRYVDLHVDVIEQRDGTVAVVDEDELRQATEDGLLDDDLAARAMRVARAVESAL